MPAASPRLYAPVFALLLVFGLAACQATPERPRLQPVTFEDRPPIVLDVAEVRVSQAYAPPMEAPYVEHLFPDPPAHAAERWARQRLAARGDRGTATFTVLDASVEEVELETASGLRGWLTTEPGQRYEARLELRMDMERGGESASLTVSGRRTTSLQEGVTLNERDEAWHRLVQRLMDDIDGQLQSSLSEGFPQFVGR